MTDEPTTTTAPASPPKKKGGWPRGRPRPRKVDARDKPVPFRRPVATARPQPKPQTEQPAWKTKYGRTPDDWDDDHEFSTPYQDRLHIDPQLVADLERENIVLQWFTASVMGQEQRYNISAAEKNGWQKVEPGEIPGIAITDMDGMVLMARPRSLHRRALQQREDEAHAPLQNMQQKHRLEGISGATGAREARGRNFHRSTIEPIDIPDGRSGRERGPGGRYQAGK